VVDHSIAPQVHEQPLPVQHNFISRRVSTYHLVKYTYFASVFIKPSWLRAQWIVVGEIGVADRNMASEDDPRLIIVLYGFVDEINVFRVILQARS
jgi:hypothetical protein